MVILIGGPPRCGKTTLARSVAKRLDIPYFSIDHLSVVIGPYIPSDRLRESFPLRFARQDVDGDNDQFHLNHSPAEIVELYRRQAATCWPGIKSFIEYALRDAHDLVLEGWQLLPEHLHELPSGGARAALQICYLYKLDVEKILLGLKANDPKNDWVLRNTTEENTFIEIARMIACFGQQTKEGTANCRFEATNTDSDFGEKIDALARSLG